MSHPKETGAVFGAMLAEQIEDYLEHLARGGSPSTQFLAGMEEAARVCATATWGSDLNGEWEKGYAAACKALTDIIRRSAKESFV